MKIYYYIILALFLIGCEKQSYTTYDVEILSQLAQSEAIGLDRNMGNAPIYITLSNYKTRIPVPSDQGIHVTVKYLNAQSLTKPVTVYISLNGKLLESKTDVGFVDINIAP